MSGKSRQNVREVDIKIEKLDVFNEKFYIPPTQYYFACCMVLKNVLLLFAPKSHILILKKSLLNIVFGVLHCPDSLLVR